MNASTLAGALLERAEGPTGGRLAVSQSRLGVWEPISWVALAVMAERIGNGLLSKGVHSGDVVAVIADNSVEYLAAQYAIAGIGATALLVPADYSPATTAALLRASNVVLAIAGDQEQFDKCVEAPEPMTVVVIETRGVRELEVAGRPDRATRATLAQLIDDAGANASWRTSVATVPTDAFALRVATIDGTNVVVSSVTHADLLAAGRSSLDAMTIRATSRLLAQRPLSELEEQVLSVGASVLSGCSVAIGEGGPLAGAELAQVAPTHLRAATASLGGIHADATRRLGETKGLKRLAVGGRLPSGPAVAAGLGRLSRLPISLSRLIGVLTSIAVFVFLLVSTNMNDWIRIVASLAIAAAGGFVFMRTPTAVQSAVKRRYGLNSCEAVIGDSAAFSSGSVEFLSGLGLPVVQPFLPRLISSGAVASSLLVGRLGSSQ